MLNLSALGALAEGPVSRRRFILGATAAGASLVVGYSFAAEGAGHTPNPFAGYVRIDPDNRVTVFSAHMDMGQGIYQGVATLAQEELDADWSKIHVAGASGNPALYGNLAMGGKFQLTGGSTGTASSWRRYRVAGATAKAMLIAAAARKWGQKPEEIIGENGVLRSKSSDASATYGEMAALAAQEPVPANVALKDPKDWKYIGSGKLPRYDSAAKVEGPPGIHDRRAPAGHPYGGDDPSAGFRRDGEELRRRQGEKRAGRGRCRRNADAGSPWSRSACGRR